jgi:hypothetical protein
MPSFAVYTQIALSAADKLVLPVMSDDSSRTAVLNIFALIHGINTPSSATILHIHSQKAGFSREIIASCPLNC